MRIKLLFINLVICLTVGGLFAYFTSAKWLAASLWVFAALYINGSIATYEDALPGGFDNPDGNETVPIANGFETFKFWGLSILVSLVATIMGMYFQFSN